MNRSFFPLILAAILLILPALALADPPAPAEVAFSPFGQSLELIVKTITSARQSILVAAYSFTSKPIAIALLDAHKRGVDVRLVIDEKANRKYTAATFLANQDVPVRTNGNYAILHNKFMVIDASTVETGSFNYTKSAAERNAENVLVLRDVPELAQQYTAEWTRLWNEGTALEKRY